MFTRHRLIWLGTFTLILCGLVFLYVSDEDAHGWWQGTLQALGVGLIVGGVVDVLVISMLNLMSKAEQERQQLRRQADEVRWALEMARKDRADTHPDPGSAGGAE
jgi:hypothetical protein